MEVERQLREKQEELERKQKEAAAEMLSATEGLTRRLQELKETGEEIERQRSEVLGLRRLSAFQSPSQLQPSSSTAQQPSATLAQHMQQRPSNDDDYYPEDEQVDYFPEGVEEEVEIAGENAIANQALLPRHPPAITVRVLQPQTRPAPSTARDPYAGQRLHVSGEERDEEFDEMMEADDA